MSDEAPPQPKGSGCIGKGCLTLFGLLVFLGIALIAGTFWGFSYLRSYSAPAPLPIPTVDISSNVEAAVEDQPAALPATPAMQVSPQQANALEDDWKTFEKAADQEEAVSIELTAVDINTLIAESNARGRVFVSIENNVARLRFSVPLAGIVTMGGRFLNGEASVEASPDGDPAKGRISNITLGGRSVPESVLDQGFFGWPSVRTLVTKWLADQQITAFRLENNRVLAETGGGR